MRGKETQATEAITHDVSERSSDLGQVIRTRTTRHGRHVESGRESPRRADRGEREPVGQRLPRHQRTTAMGHFTGRRGGRAQGRGRSEPTAGEEGDAAPAEKVEAQVPRRHQLHSQDVHGDGSGSIAFPNHTAAGVASNAKLREPGCSWAEGQCFCSAQKHLGGVRLPEPDPRRGPGRRVDGTWGHARPEPPRDQAETRPCASPLSPSASLVPSEIPAECQPLTPCTEGTSHRMPRGHNAGLHPGAWDREQAGRLHCGQGTPQGHLADERQNWGDQPTWD